MLTDPREPAEMELSPEALVTALLEVVTALLEDSLGEAEVSWRRLP